MHELSIESHVHAAQTHLRTCDPTLRIWMERIGPFVWSPRPCTSTFQAVAESILYQQLSTKAAQSISKKFRDALGTDGHFPTPQQMEIHTPDTLRAVGISNSKARSILEVAERSRAGQLPELGQLANLDESSLADCLTSVRGVGPWTVHMVLLFRLGRMDILPITDYGIRKGFATVFDRSQIPSPDEVAQYGERWRPYRSVASWYLWRSLDWTPGESEMHK